jgi:ribosomal protein S24E
MKFDIKGKNKNPLMKRDEIVVSIDHAGKATPNRILVLSEIAKLVKSNPENIIIDRIITPGGSTVSEVKVFSYSKKDDIPGWRLKKMEQRASKIKGKPKEEPKPAPVSEPKSDGEPAEETKKEPREGGKPAESPREAPAGDAGKTTESPEEGKPSSEDKEKKEDD